MVSCRLRKPYFLLVFTYMWLWLLWTSSCIIVKAANHTLKQGDSLNGTNKLCSDGSYYCIGFVAQPGGLSYLTITSDTKNNPWEVWIANRNEPIFNNSGLLSLDHSGVLKIESQGRKPIVLYTPPPQSTNKNSIVATILDTGNFLVQQLHPNGSTMSVLWQSFDYPTDCLLPGMKLGVNHKTGQNWSLVSWVSETFPAPGSFRLEWEPREHELIMKREEQVIWKSGKLINNRFFENIQKESQHIYQYNQVSNEDEDYFIFTTPNTKEPTKWALFETGELIGSEVKEIARADTCYGYNTDRGCQKWEIPTCRKPGDAFDSREGYPNTSGNDTSIEPNKMYGIGDCQASCWSNCSCVGFKSYDDSGGTGCIFFYGKTLDGATLVSVGQKFNMLVKKPHHKGTNKWIWIGTAIATFLLIICSAILCLAIMKRKYMLKDKRRMESETQGLADSDDGSAGVKDLEDNLSKGHDFKVFSYASVKEATTNFSSKNQLGEGGFGPVYKGVLPTGREVAVKRLAKTSGQGTVEFKNELMLICELQHTNLVKLLGCCIHGKERMLIYEYMQNKSLDFFIFDDTRNKLLDWQKRFNIIEGLSHGLLYLHKYSRLKIIHRDLKASNILLDENMNPKISDFGMARMFTQQQSTVNTNKIVGTYGYMSPEYVMEGIFSTKSDVYSYGVLLLEIVSGRMNNSCCDDDQPLNLVGHAWELWNDGVCLELMDPSLNDTFVPEEVQRCIHVGLLCVEHYAKDRPDMSDIISMLTNKTAPVTMPRRPAFYVGRQMGDGGTSSKSVESNTFYTKEISDSSEIESR